MTAMLTGLLVVLLGVASASAGEAGDDPYQLTEHEKAACTHDAIRLCSDAYPDEGKLLVCMKQNWTSLSPTCRPVFQAGLERRHLAK